MLYEWIVVSTALYGAETLGLREAERRKLDIFEMGCQRSICGLKLLRNEESRRRMQVERQSSGSVDQCVLRWFGHLERVDEERMAKMMNSNVEGNRCKGRPRLGWRDGI